MGAIDISECPTRRQVKTRYGTTAMLQCRCKPVCSVCGQHKHSAVHGPIYGQPPGSVPWGHEYHPGGGAADSER